MKKRTKKRPAVPISPNSPQPPKSPISRRRGRHRNSKSGKTCSGLKRGLPVQPSRSRRWHSARVGSTRAPTASARIRVRGSREQRSQITSAEKEKHLNFTLPRAYRAWCSQPKFDRPGLRWGSGDSTRHSLRWYRPLERRRERRLTS